MKVTIAISGSPQFPLEVERTDTVAHFREVLFSDEHFPKGIDPDSVKIICFGTFLDDLEKTLEDYKVNDNSRLIIYIQKKPAAPKPAEAPKAETKPVAAPVAPVAPATPSREPPVAPAAPVAPPAQSVPQPAADVDVAKLEQMMLMGFEEDDCRRALRASRGNVELAVDYVLNGHIPEAPVAPPRNPPAGAAPMVPPGMFSGEMVQELVQYLQQTDPALYAQVQANPALLGQILQAAAMGAAGGPGYVAPGPGTAAGAGGSSSVTATLTAPEDAQVRQISEMTGMDYERCKVVFVRLGKDANAACDIILESSDRMRMMTPEQLDQMLARLSVPHPPAGQAGGDHWDYGNGDEDEDMDGDEDNDEDDFYL